MTTKSRTGLLLGFTAVMMTASLSGCFVETSGGGAPSGSCSSERFFEVYWSVALDSASPPYTCSQTPTFTEVQLDTNTGLTYRVGKECRATRYDNFVFDWAGSTDAGIPAGTYVTNAHLIGPDGVTPMSTAPGPGAQYQVPSCGSQPVAFIFDLT